MVSDHYDLLAASKIKRLFPDDEKGLAGAKQRSADFFIQRLGGPDYFNQRRGSPQLASRHLPFRIDGDARVIWLQCYAKVLAKLENVPEPVIEAFCRITSYNVCYTKLLRIPVCHLILP